MLQGYADSFIKRLYFVKHSFRFGFVQGHSYLTENQSFKLEQVLNSKHSEGVVAEYEQQMTTLIGSGYGISFAAGRMAFYMLMKAMGIGEGDEVLLPGFTCSVMTNAVWRTGATPVFADIDADTFGSKAEEIEKKISSRTKMIVAQHSFGIPCDIQPIIELGKKHGIFVVEDCAITLDSSINGIKVGNWADASIFSTDHTKPLNTLIGGFLYTKDEFLYKKIKSLSVGLPHLNKNHQARLYRRFLFERKYYMPENYQMGIFLNKLYSLKRRLKLNSKCTFLDSDYTKQFSTLKNYPYPAKTPPFLAQLGLFELERWDTEKKRRKKLLNSYINIMKQSNYNKYLPKVYLNSKLEIVPLRFIFVLPDSKHLLNKMARFIDVNMTWFRTPIICCPDGPEGLGYEWGNCPESERMGLNIVNWPCMIPEDWASKILDIFQDAMNEKIKI